MNASEQRRPGMAEMTRGQVLWEYLKESTVVEIRTYLGMLVAPFRAIWAVSLEPIRSAFRHYMEDGDEVFYRYWPREDR